MRTAIAYLYTFFFFATPLIFFPNSSEIFELPKIVFVYLTATLASSMWILRMVLEKKLIFTRSKLDVPLAIFLTTQAISTYFSIDILTSMQGYYSRFYGGLLSLFAFSLLYWVAVSNLTKKDLVNVFKALVASGLILSIWAIMERYGLSPSCLFINGNIASSCWSQTIQERPFASLGQPNWLAAYLAMVIPIVWTVKKNKKNNIYLYFGWVMYLALLLTKSRSGLIGLVAAFFVFWVLKIIKSRSKKLMTISFIKFVVPYILLFIFFFPFSIHNKQNPDPTVTSSVDIRKLLWNGAVNIWQDNPIVGTGPETFAYSYYLHRPLEHNQTSEWNFVYNKAHNEYLNYFANTGLLGTLPYLLLILFSLKVLVKNNIALFAGYVSLLVSNLFSFTTVATGLLFFLYPALASKGGKEKKWRNFKLKKGYQIIAISIVLFLNTYAIKSVMIFAYADYLYAKKDFESIKKSAEIAPYQPQYLEKIGDLKVKDLAPKNVKLLKNLALKYMASNPDEALEILDIVENIAPTDPMVPYFKGLAYINSGNKIQAHKYLLKAIEMKPNYKEAQQALLLNEVNKSQ